MVHKAVACVIRDTPDGLKLLVFTHPAGMVQVPKGGIDPGESPEEAVLRELREESGLTDAVIVSAGPQLTRRVPRGPQGEGPDEDQTWHLFRLHPLIRRLMVSATRVPDPYMTIAATRFAPPTRLST